MRSIGEHFVCLTHPAFKELDDAIEVRHVMRCHGVQGWTIESCLICGGFHLRKPSMSRDKRRLLWFLACVIVIVLAAVGASVFNSLFWFGAWELIGFMVAVVGVYWQYGKL